MWGQNDWWLREDQITADSQRCSPVPSCGNMDTVARVASARPTTLFCKGFIWFPTQGETYAIMCRLCSFYQYRKKTRKNMVSSDTIDHNINKLINVLLNKNSSRHLYDKKWRNLLWIRWFTWTWSDLASARINLNEICEAVWSGGVQQHIPLTVLLLDYRSLWVSWLQLL